MTITAYMYQSPLETDYADDVDSDETTEVHDSFFTEGESEDCYIILILLSLSLLVQRT